MLGPEVCTMKCPQCQAEIQTGIKTKPGLVPICSGILICLFGCVLGCCLIPCFIKDCLDVEHFCPSCNAYLGRFKRFL
ncbi:cell death-inducing p53-target protein 1 [Daphnia magna]|uniref:cell death-inducing p53-target protein 1 n=1 Tax=Daphnia magna TaxID=35525 RepID=UPI001E1BA062|nr:cell death-inducing p53-target protein 1 [Daphnia magna]XP_032785479.2 cell death-inducing p53-target protein 1 [Daphnia magna]